MRISGIDRLSSSLEALIKNGGSVSGAVGIDGRVTTIEALEALNKVSKDSTIFHTISGFIFHPKLYLIDFKGSALAVIGSSNMTRDGLYRNLELSCAIHLDLSQKADSEIYGSYDTFLNLLLDNTNPNVKPIDDNTIRILSELGIIEKESASKELGATSESGKGLKSVASRISALFPPLKVPLAPPILQPIIPSPPVVTGAATKPTTSSIFLMQLSSFDSSHRTGKPGTPEVLIPHEAMSFFPPISVTQRKYPDAFFDVILNTPTGQIVQKFRLWYYEQRAKDGSKIDENRLRMTHTIIDLSDLAGGDLLIINKLPINIVPAYEVTVLPKSDPGFAKYLSLCVLTAANVKKWGMA